MMQIRSEEKTGKKPGKNQEKTGKKPVEKRGIAEMKRIGRN